MHFAQEQGTPPKHVDERLLTVKDADDPLAYAESELRELHEQVTDPNFRIFADSEWIYVFNRDLFVKGTDFNEIFDKLEGGGTHARVLPGQGAHEGEHRARPEEELPAGSPLDWGYLSVRGASTGARQAHDESADEVVTSVAA